jgi:hypothetical protein
MDHPRFVKIVIILGVLVTVYFWVFIEVSGNSENWSWEFNLVSSFLWPMSLWVGRFIAISAIVSLAEIGRNPEKL